jgi:hypothetical protein
MRTVKGRRYPKVYCRKCDQSRARTYETLDSRKRREEKKQAKIKFERQHGINRAKYIVEDSRKSDRKRGLENDLSIKFVDELIANGCSYCGETTITMTVDRKNNSIGHTMDNVVACCIRCNLLRRDMPYEAWFLLVDKIREIRVAGVFGDWLTTPTTKRSIGLEPDGKATP